MARSTKFATVIGILSWYNSALNSPSDVVNLAVGLPDIVAMARVMRVAAGMPMPMRSAWPDRANVKSNVALFISRRWRSDCAQRA